jgi:hypothetical protein
MSPQVFYKTVLIRDWRVVDALAAELIVVHKIDLNQIQRGANYIMTKKPGSYEALTAYLNAQIEAARYFPRSQQTLNHAATLYVLVEFLWTNCVKKNSRLEKYQSVFPLPLVEMFYLATLLSWIARKAIYYRRNFAKADQKVDRRDLYLKITLPKIALQKPIASPTRNAAPPTNDRISSQAEQFMELLKRRNQGKSEE